MERILWILSKFSFRVIVILLAIADYLVCNLLYQSGELTPLLVKYKWLFILLGILLLCLCVACGIMGGTLGYKYVEMGRSRRWHYVSNTYQRKDDRLRNTLYWAGKFACFPVIIAQILMLALVLTYLL